MSKQAHRTLSSFEDVSIHITSKQGRSGEIASLLRAVTHGR